MKLLTMSIFGKNNDNILVFMRNNNNNIIVRFDNKSEKLIKKLEKSKNQNLLKSQNQPS